MVTHLSASRVKGWLTSLLALSALCVLAEDLIGIEGTLWSFFRATVAVALLAAVGLWVFAMMRERTAQPFIVPLIAAIAVSSALVAMAAFL